MLKFRILHLILALGLWIGLQPTLVLAQNSDRRLYQKALQKQRVGKIERAVKLHKQYLKHHNDWQSKWHLAQCYDKLGIRDEQERMLTDLVFSKPHSPEFKLQLAEFLKQQGKNEAAKLWYEKYAQEGPDSIEARRLVALCDAATLLQKDTSGYQIAAIPGLNSANDEGLVWLEGSDLILLSSRKGHPATFKAALANDGSLGKLAATRLSGLSKGVNVSILAAGPRKGETTLAEGLGIRHFCISPNGKLKVLALREPSGLGGTDLYGCTWTGSEWSSPENLGPEINSIYDEELPYMSNDSTIFFSSNRPEGFGGLDIYSADRIGDRWINVRHEGAPLNSPSDEWGFCMIPGQSTGYFVSNRPGGMGGADIWQLRRFKLLQAQVVDGESYLPLPGAKIDLVDINQKHHSYFTDAQGRFTHVMRAGQEVYAKCFHPACHDLSQTISLRSVGYDQNLSMILPMQPLRRHQLEGLIVDAYTQKPLEGVTVRIVSDKDLRSFSNRKGTFTQDLQPNTFYRAIYYLSGYVPQILEFKTGDEAEAKTLKHKIVLGKGGFHYLEGRTIDTERDIMVGGATIHFLDGKTNQEISTTTVGPDGSFYKVLEADRDYTIISSKGKYLSASVNIPEAVDKADTLLKSLEMIPIFPDKVISTVYFPFGGSTIDAAGFKEVAKVIYMLKENPSLGLELTAYTDARGSASANKLLSQRRADALAAYLVTKGIESSRIRSYGKGEEKPFNNCVDGVNCSEELHSQNRRAEIRLVRLGDQ